MKHLFKIGFVLAGATFLFACQNLVTPVGRQQTTPTVAPTVGADDSAQKLNTVQQQGFKFVYVFRRKDGALLDSEDKKYLRANSPIETNQWVVTDDGKAAIAGSNYQFPPAVLEKLRERFNAEDLSKPTVAEPEENANANR